MAVLLLSEQPFGSSVVVDFRMGVANQAGLVVVDFGLGVVTICARMPLLLILFVQRVFSSSGARDVGT